MKRTDFHYPSSDGKNNIHAVIWEPEQPAVGLIQIAHGITEHMGCYEKFAGFFCGKGYIVAGNDHLGHGLSQDKTEDLPAYFGPKGSWSFVTKDIISCSAHLKEAYPGLPLCLMGFSLGSFAVRCIVSEEAQLADMTVWAGTGQMKNMEIAIAKAVVALEEARFGDKNCTPLIHKLTMDTYNQKFKPCRTEADWLCANSEAIDAYIADPLCCSDFTVSSFRELLSGMSICSSKNHLSSMKKELPILLLSGDKDPVGNFGKGVEAVYEQLKASGFSSVEKQLFPDMRHHIFLEKDSLAVFERIYSWLEKCKTL